MDTLESLDRQLLDLLAKRVGLLSDGESTSDSELPGHVWRALDVHTRAAARSTNKRFEQAPRSITIVGGHGMMGRFLADRFTKYGHRVRSLDTADWDRADDLLSGIDLALLAVPIGSTREVIDRVCEHLSVGVCLGDITSTKTPYAQQMMDRHRGPVLSLHPMFGPGVESFLSQRVIACRLRDATATRWITDLIEADGGIVIDADPEEHDRMMTSVQAIRHFATICLGRFLADEPGAAKRSLEFASPIYRIELDMVERLFAQDASLYADILLASADRRAAAGRFAALVSDTASIVASNDRDGLIELFDRIGGALDAEPDRALGESSYLVEALCCYLAARDADSS